ncbi:MAG TPA: DEAD/DEAH box helicase family protein [Hyphomicrobiaceae bacterium]|jgi:superfamily II DNA or RNA helicase/very-short-patch-repair endonuclease
MESGTPIDCQSPAEAKVRLFRSLFRGREDVYARRFENRRTGKHGYAPACANEWVRGLCEKPRVKCADCTHRRFLPLTDDVIRWHLSGADPSGEAFVAGVYALLPDDTCRFLAIDFDKSGWRADAAACIESCRRLNLPAAFERSRSGLGGHLWVFFEEPIPAALARRLGSHVLTETMEQRPELGLDSYDRLFPSQDTLPQGGFGSLIALPLQKEPRDRGNSVFLDVDLKPWADQWAFLASLHRLGREQVERTVRTAERRGRVLGVHVPPQEDDEQEPWNTPPSRRPVTPPISGTLPESIELVLGSQIYISKEGLLPSLRNRLLRLAAFQNPAFYQAQALRLSTYGTPRIIACAEDFPHHIGLPRGLLDEVLFTLGDLGIATLVRDERCAGRPLAAVFQGRLRPEQQSVAEALLAHDTGVLAATTAFGKTVIGAWLIAERRVSTLVLVHRRQLLEQWVERLAMFLDLPPEAIGRIGGGRRRPTGLVEVAMIQSLARKGEVDDCVADYGQLIVDECHHLPARSFEQVARQAKARFVVGLSATVTRKDGHHPIVFMQCGPVRHRVDVRTQAAIRPFEHRVLVRPTAFQRLKPPEADKRQEFQALYRALIDDDARTRLICEDVMGCVRAGRSPLVLTERNAHLDRLAQALEPRVRHAVVLRAGMGRKERERASARLVAIPRDEERVVIATGKNVGEGFDDPRLDTLFLTLPVSWRGTIAQYAGRLHRLSDGKQEVRIYDYADLDAPMLARMFDRRCRGYEAIGYTVVLPASAIRGWPVDVVLPADPAWKRDYAGSVQRLVRDGVDTPLASLFLHATRTVHADAEGVDRARSATEAFLFRRLESLAETKGRFRLNERLPIAFDASGALEVDLLCAEARVAIELDGAQHLANADAYRRDRRKDRLLQENGYFVLRFLAEDVGKDLDRLLDAILRALGRRS